MDEKRLRELAGLEILEEAAGASGPLQAAFNTDTAIFPVTVKIWNSFTAQHSNLWIDVRAASGKTLNKTAALTAKRISTLARKNKLGGKAKLNTGVGSGAIVQFDNETLATFAKDSTSFKALQMLSKRMKSPLGKATGVINFGDDAKRQKTVIKSYQSLVELSQALDNIGK